MKQSIIRILNDHPGGITAREIANKLGIGRELVNQLLYGPLRGQCVADTSYRWRLINSVTPVQSNVTQGTAITADPLLNKLCKYYLNCISLEGTNKISVFRDSQFTPDYVEIDSLDFDALHSNSVVDFMRQTTQLRNKVMYMGYPTAVYSFTANNGVQYTKIAPIFLFQVTYDAGAESVAAVPTINMEIMKQYCTNDENEQLHEMIRLENELGLNNPDAEFDMYDLVTRLYHIRHWNWKDEMNPESFNPLPMEYITEDGIYNKAVILRTDASNYTQGLEYELLELSRLSEDQYRGTALYDWIHRDDVDNLEENTTDEEILEVLPLNTEQSEAIKKSLASKLTVITGPPGTGKSQVVTNLIINLAWKGKKGIFSSKNNKAVDVVEKRVNGLTNRPVMLRMGSRQGVDAIISFLNDLKNYSPANYADHQEYKEIKEIYNTLQSKIDILLKQKESLISSRNQLDEIEKAFCEFRQDWENISAPIDEYHVSLFSDLLNNAMLKYDAAQKNLQPFIVRLFWRFLSSSRVSKYLEAAENLDEFLRKYNQPCLGTLATPKDSLFLGAKKVADELHTIAQYNKHLSALQELPSLENIDKQLIEIRKEQAKIAHQLWEQWVKTIGFRIPASLRDLVTEFIATLKLNGNDTLSPDEEHILKRIQSQIKDILPICAVTSLSVRKRIPFIPGMYDLLIIDEASQCDIPSILPLLYRCKSAVIIGDPMQLSHITGLTNQQDKNLLSKYEIAKKYSFNIFSLYDLAADICRPENIIQLKDHHRCHGDIIEFSNREFYRGQLRIATNYNRLKSDSKLGVRWVDVQGKTRRPSSGSAFNLKEVEAVVNELKHLVASGYRGTIGVVAPFRAHAEKINRAIESDSALYNKLLSVNQFMADTVHKFQGDERDLIIFSTVVSTDVQTSSINFLKSTGNLFNVAITRAKSTLIVVGDQEVCKGCGVPYLERFVEYVMSQENIIAPVTDIHKDHGPVYPDLPCHIMDTVSDWEKYLYEALYAAGIKTHPQHEIDKYRLDLALFHNNRRLDIEVDGERYHRSWNGELCYRDQLRNQRMFELGWDVKRFWVYEIRDRLPWCIEQIKAWMNQS